MATLAYIIVANVLISLASMSLALLLSVRSKKLSNISIYLVSFSAGTLLGGAFLHLLPEGLESGDPQKVLIATMLSILVFLATEKFLNWHHCHDEKHFDTDSDQDCDHFDHDHTDNNKVETFGLMSLIGDSVHNFLDGLIIAAAFIVDFNLGVVTTIAVAFHEIPQELGDFGVLIHAGYTKRKALILNLLVSFTAIVGGIVGFFAVNRIEGIEPYLLALAAGGFLYISIGDLIPEVRGSHHKSKLFWNFVILCLGILFMYLVTFFE